MRKSPFIFIQTMIIKDSRLGIDYFHFENSEINNRFEYLCGGGGDDLEVPTFG